MSINDGSHKTAPQPISLPPIARKSFLAIRKQSDTLDFKGLDKASVRRFNRKFHFDFLNATGVRSFYDRMLAPLAVGQLAGHQNQRLARLGRLASGDFKNVRDRFALADSRHDHENLVAGLEEEEGIKKSQAGGSAIGF